MLALSLQRGTWQPAAIDLAACAAAALTARWPRAAGIALATILAALLPLPSGWPSMAEYAALIPILGTGIRGQQRERLWMTILYGLILAALSYDIARGWTAWPFALAVWAALIAVMWGIGNLFTAYRSALKVAHDAELREERLVVARDLHDTVSRELARASLHAQAARRAHPSPELDSAVKDIQRASTQLRWVLALLRDDPFAAETDQTDGSAADILQTAIHALEAKGFTVSTTVDGDLDSLQPALIPTVRAVIGEACANIERHANPRHPCTIVLSIDENALDIVFMNEISVGINEPASLGLGLTGLGERLALIEGHLAVEQEGSQWFSRVTIPL